MPKRMKIVVAQLSLLMGSITCGVVHAGFLEDVGRVVTAPIIAPADATLRVLRGDNPKEAVSGPFQSAGRVIQQSSDQYQKAQNLLSSAPRDAIKRNLGGDWDRAFDTLAASQRVQYELASTGGRFLGKCLQGQPCGLNELTAAPLAAAMRDAYKVYIGYSSPLDPKVIQVLSRVVPIGVLHVARISSGATPDFTVPGMLNSGHEVAGHGHAVTLANLMIFSRPLNFQSLSDWNWLLHEVRHIEQYMGYSNDTLESIDGFAVAYIQNYQGIENDAQSNANARQASLNQMCQYGGC